MQNPGPDRRADRNKINIQKKEIHLRDYVQAILRRKWIVIVSFIIVLTTVAIHTFKAAPIYQATVQLQIDKEDPNVVSVKEMMVMDSNDLLFYQTQYKILSSRSLALRVINSMNLKDSPEFNPGGKSKGFSIGDMFKKQNPEKESPGTDKDTDKDSGKDTDKNSDKTATQRGKDFDKDTAQLGKEDENLKLDENSGLIRKYLERLAVAPIRKSRLVNISFTGYDPVEVAKIVNKHAEEYIERNLEVRFAASQDAAEWLQNQIYIKKDALDKSENALQLYKEKEKILSLEDKQNIIVQKFESLNRELTRAKTEKMGLVTIYNKINEYAGNYEKLGELPDVIENLLIRDLRREHSRLRAEVKRLSQKYGKNYPAMKRAVAQMEEAKAMIDEEIGKIAKSIQSKYEVALSKVENLSKALEDQKEEALELNRKAIAYGALKRDIDGERAMYDLLLKRMEEADVTSQLKTSNINIVDQAAVPRSPIKPNKKLNIILGAIVGLGLGIGLVFFLEYLDNTIKSPEDVEDYLEIPLLGVLSHVKISFGGKSAPSELIAHEMPRSVFAEAVRSIRTSVMFSIIDTSRKLIMVTSATQGEGKTFIASNLAAAIAQAGKNTLLVDTDLRKPRVNKVFSVEKNPGLCNHLIGEIELESIIKSTQVPNLSVVTCGNIPPNPSEIMQSAVMGKFCDTVRERFDIVIFDTPPSMTVTDAVVLSSIVDGVIITIKSGVAVKDTVKRCISQIRKNKGEILGAVVNSVDISRGGYYYHYYAHYYKYGYSSEKEWEEVEKT